MSWKLFSVIIGYAFLISLVLFGLVVLCLLFCLVHIIRSRGTEKAEETDADVAAEESQPKRTAKGPAQPGKPSEP